MSGSEPPGVSRPSYRNRGFNQCNDQSPDRAHEHAANGAVVEHSEAIGDLHLAADNFSGAAEKYRSVLEGLSRSRPADRVRVLRKLAEAEYARSAFAESQNVLEEARETARLLGDPRVTAKIVANLASVLIELGRYRASFALRHVRVPRAARHRRAQDRGTARPSRSGSAARDWVAPGGHRLAAERGRDVPPHRRHRRPRDRAQQPRARLQEPARVARGDAVPRAGAQARRACGTLRAHAHGHHQNLGLIRYRLGQWDLAEEHFRQSLKIARETGHAQSEAAALLALGMLMPPPPPVRARRRAFPQRARRWRRRCAPCASSCWRAEFLGELALDRGDARRRPWRCSSPRSRGRSNLAPAGRPRRGAATTASAWRSSTLGQRRRPAQAHLLRGVALCEQLGDRIEQAIADARARAARGAARGNPSALEFKIRGAAQCFESLSETFELATTLGDVGETCCAAAVERSRLRLSLEPVGEAAQRARRRCSASSASCRRRPRRCSRCARLETERERYDQALSLLEQAEQWLAESGDPEPRDAPSRCAASSSASTSRCRCRRATSSARSRTRTVCSARPSDMDGSAEPDGEARRRARAAATAVSSPSAAAAAGSTSSRSTAWDASARVASCACIESAAGSRIAESGPLFSSRVAADPRFSVALADALEGVGSLVCVPLNFPSQALGPRVRRPAQRQPARRVPAARAQPARRAREQRGGGDRRGAALACCSRRTSELRDKLKPSPGLERIVTQSREMQSILTPARQGRRQLRRPCCSWARRAPARACSPRSCTRSRTVATAPFVQVNCAALPEHAARSELFGYVQRRVHRRGARQVRPVRGGRGRNDLPRRDREGARVRAGQAAPRARSQRDPPGGRDAAARGERARDLRDRRATCARRIKRGPVPRGSLLPPQRHHRARAGAARAARGHSAAGPALPRLSTRARWRSDVAGFSPEVMRVFLAHEWRGNVREAREDGEAPGRARRRRRSARRRAPAARDARTASAARPTAPRRRLSLRSNISRRSSGSMIAQALDRNRWNIAHGPRASSGSATRRCSPRSAPCGSSRAKSSTRPESFEPQSLDRPRRRAFSAPPAAAWSRDLMRNLMYASTLGGPVSSSGLSLV